jgi:putative transposase
MPDYRRYFVAGGTYFFSLVTADRAPLFGSAEARRLLGQLMRQQRNMKQFDTIAIVLLPDHLHTIWTLPAGDSDYSNRWKAIKATFTSAWVTLGGDERAVSKGYQRQRRRGVWQPRFIEHTIRDEQDLHDHANYIHYNPVKHGYVRRPADWPWSSFHRYVLSGDYSEWWGGDGRIPPDLGKADSDVLE